MSFWNGKTVFLTGHTGFKGAWMSLMLTGLGARVTGYALPPEQDDTLFDLCDVAGRIADSRIADILDVPTLSQAIAETRPDVIFHLAAQSLVLRSYQTPLETFSTNVMGTANVLEAARQLDTPCAVVIVTTDKVYDNREWVYPFRETDRLGSADPYSASKAAAELVTTTWRKSFAPAGGAGMRIASARAGNVIGGGDWAQDRLIPDCMRAFSAGTPAGIRNPASVRPWQHALDPLLGYMMVAERLLDDSCPEPEEPMWNFGPDLTGEASVMVLARRALDIWGGDARLDIAEQKNAPKEARLLRLDIAKAQLELGWRPVWNFAAAIDATIGWYKAWHEGRDMIAFTDQQITNFLADAGTVAAS